MTLSLPGYTLSDLPRALKAHVPLKALRDRANRLRYGPGAPLSDEPIFADPCKVTRAYQPRKGAAPIFRRRHSGLVAAGDWDLALGPLQETYKTRALWAHFDRGLSWAETGIIEATLEEIAAKGASDGLTTREQVVARYTEIDRLYDSMARDRRQHLRQDLGLGFRRELGGVYAHVTRSGEVVRSGGGQHRFEIARILRLPEIPFQLGVIHRDAVRAGHLEQLRQSRYDGASQPA